MLPVGIGYGLMAATVTAVVFAAASQIPFATAGPDSKPVAVLAALAAGIAADPSLAGHGDKLGPTVLLGLIFGTVLTGIVLYLLGVLRTAGWIRFVPYPVMGGFLAASGWLLIAGSVHVMTGTRISLVNLGDLISPAYVWQFAVGILLVAAIGLLRRIRHPLTFPVFLVVATLTIHGVLQAMGISLAEARAAHWLIDVRSGVQLPDLWFSGAIADVEPGAIVRAAANYAALIVVTASTVLLNTMGTEVETRIDADLDRELRITGLSNLLSGALGGMVGTLSLSRTLFSYRAGARRRIGGFVTGAVCLVMLGLGTEGLGFIPVPLVGALLMQLGATVLYEWLVQGWRRMPPIEYALLVAILLLIVLRDFLAGMAVGIVAACVIFAINSSRVRVVKRGLSRSEFGSRVDRPAEQLKQLLEQGQAIQILWLHGFLFFGSTNRLVEELKQIVARAASGRACRMFVLDFHQVLGIDSSAVDSLRKLRHFAEREGLFIAVSDLSPAVQGALRPGGFFEPEDAVCQEFSSLDAALECCEDRLLAEHVGQHNAMHSADEWLAREIGGEEQLHRLKAYMKMVKHQRGDLLCAQGDAADALYIINTGRVTVLFTTPEKQEIRLRSMLRHTVVGEMGFYRSAKRGASI